MIIKKELFKHLINPSICVIKPKLIKKAVKSPTIISIPAAYSGILRLCPLLFPPAIHHQLPCLHNRTDILSVGSSEPHESLSEQIIRAILIMRAVYFTEIFGSMVCVVKLKYLLRRDYMIEITENEENREMSVEFLENTQVVNSEEVEAQFLTRTLLDQVQQWL